MEKLADANDQAIVAMKAESQKELEALKTKHRNEIEKVVSEVSDKSQKDWPCGTIN